MTNDDETGEAMIATDGVEPEPTVFSERQLKEAERIAEALVFASAEPVSIGFIAERLPRGMDVVAILHALMRRAGHVLSRAQLEQALYSWGDEVESNAIEVHIYNLRKKLGSGLIQTVRHQGYKLASP